MCECVVKVVTYLSCPDTAEIHATRNGSLSFHRKNVGLKVSFFREGHFRIYGGKAPVRHLNLV